MKYISRLIIFIGIIFMTGVVHGQEGAMASPKILQTYEGLAYHKTLDILITECLVKREKVETLGTIIGDIQYGIDRVDSEWFIYLYSPKHSGKTVDVEINLDMKKVRLVVVSRDLLSNERFLGYTLKVPVAQGQYRILRIQTEPFEPDYEGYFD